MCSVPASREVLERECGMGAALREAAGLGGDDVTERRAPYGSRRIFELTVEGNPIPKGRPRVVDSHAYTPQATRDYEALVRDAAALEWKQEPMRGSLSIHLSFYRANRRRADLDNLMKAVVDALQGIVLFDDNQIVTALIVKKVDRERPRVEITIIPI